MSKASCTARTTAVAYIKKARDWSDRTELSARNRRGSNDGDALAERDDGG